MTNATRESFLTACTQLKQQLSSEQNTLEEIDRGVHNMYSQFNSDASRCVEHAQEKLQEFTQDSLLVQNVNQFMLSLKTQQNEFSQQYEMLQKTNSFKEQYKDSLLIYVFGKVKTGKSSLGNYLGLGIPNPSKEQAAQNQQSEDAPKFQTLGINEKTGRLDNVEHLHHFVVGVTETTSTVQSICLPGFTFVDSPGVHSVTQSNEVLAKSYLQHADLILYTESSDSPGRTSDSAEILDIIAHGYTPIIVINKSDVSEEDIDDAGELITVQRPKDPETRKAQEESVKANVQALQSSYLSELKYPLQGKDLANFESNVANLQIMSISSSCAYTAKDEQEFAASGMSNFLDLLQNTITSDGVKLKRDAPLKLYQGFLVNLSNTFNEFALQLQKLQKLCKDNQNKMHHLLKQELDLSKPALLNIFEQTFEKVEKERNKFTTQAELEGSKFQELLSQSLNTVSQEFQNLGSQVLVKVASELSNDFNAQSFQLQIHQPKNVPTFKIEEGQFERQYYYTPSRGGSRFWGGLIGGAIGFFTGGPAGAAVGAVAGAALGGKAAGSGSVRTEMVSYKTGDNFYEVKQRCQDELILSFEKEVLDQANQLFNSMFEQFQAVLKELEQLIHATAQQQSQIQSQITKLRSNIGSY